MDVIYVTKLQIARIIRLSIYRYLVDKLHRHFSYDEINEMVDDIMKKLEEAEQKMSKVFYDGEGGRQE